MEIAPTTKRTSSVAAVSIPPVVIDRERAQSKVVRYGNRTYGETNILRSGGFIPPVVLDRECEQSKDVRYGTRTYGETNVIRSGGFHTAGRD